MAFPSAPTTQAKPSGQENSAAQGSGAARRPGREDGGGAVPLRTPRGPPGPAPPARTHRGPCAATRGRCPPPQLRRSAAPRRGALPAPPPARARPRTARRSAAPPDGGCPPCGTRHCGCAPHHPAPPRERRALRGRPYLTAVTSRRTKPGTAASRGATCVGAMGAMRDRPHAMLLPAGRPYAHRPVEAAQQHVVLVGRGVAQGGHEGHVQRQLAGHAQEGGCGDRRGSASPPTPVPAAPGRVTPQPTSQQRRFILCDEHRGGPACCPWVRCHACGVGVWPLWGAALCWGRLFTPGGVCGLMGGPRHHTGPPHQLLHSPLTCSSAGLQRGCPLIPEQCGAGGSSCAGGSGF